MAKLERSSVQAPRPSVDAFGSIVAHYGMSQAVAFERLVKALEDYGPDLQLLLLGLSNPNDRKALAGRLAAALAGDSDRRPVRVTETPQHAPAGGDKPSLPPRQSRNPAAPR